MDYILNLNNEQIPLLKPGSIYMNEQMNIYEILKYTDRHKQDSHSDSQITQEGISKEVAPLRRQSVT